MIAYLDASVLLRIHLRQSAPLPEWDDLTHGITSELTIVECHRTAERFMHTGRMTAEQAEELKGTLAGMFDDLDVRAISRAVMRGARGAFPTPLGSLDAIHLTTAVLVRETHATLHFATHDNELAIAARALHFPILGV